MSSTTTSMSTTPSITIISTTNTTSNQTQPTIVTGNPFTHPSPHLQPSPPSPQLNVSTTTPDPSSTNGRSPNPMYVLKTIKNYNHAKITNGSNRAQAYNINGKRSHYTNTTNNHKTRHQNFRNGTINGSSDLESEFLHAVEFGDVSLVKRLLQQHPNLDVDCTDGLGRTPLRMAVKNENKDLVEILLGLSSPNNIYESLLQAIDAGFTTIAEATLRHPRYRVVLDKRRRMGDTDGFFKPEHGSQFPSYVTPLNLAAQKEQYVIVKLLLQRGETIERPHKCSCSCQECLNKNKFDQLRMAKCRLDAYRGLASEAYISLNFQDPILTAMELAEELKKQAVNELYFKLEYNELVERVSRYVVKLVDRVWTHQELDIVLDKTGTPWEDRYENMARLQMAIDCQQKQFVAHPNCQQRIIQKWYKGTSKFSTAGWNQKLVIIILSVLAFPFAVLVFLVRPKSKFSHFLSLPTVKFIGHALSYFILLALIIYSCKETEIQISSTHTLHTIYPELHTRYTHFRNMTRRYACGHDFPLRMNKPTVTGVMLNIWIGGLIAQECQELWKTGLLSHAHNYYNFMDFLLLSVYTATFTLGHLVMRRVVNALEYFKNVPDITTDPDLTESHIYWLNADRRFWHMTDPINMKEGLFAMANILSFTRITYLLPAIEILGPLQISLGRMVNDVIQFMSMSAIIIAGFMISLRNLFWYYANRREIELEPDRIEDPTAVQYYGSDKATFRTVFWAIFGRGGTKAVSLGGYNNTVTEQIGQAIDGLYHITMIILMLNVFIAMMTRSYEQIVADEDVEWKFARSSLYMDYISKGKLLPVPLNILEILHHSIRHCFRGIGQFRPFQHPIQKMRKSLSERRRPAMVATKSTRDKLKRFTVHECSEMGTINRQPSMTVPGSKKGRALSTRSTLYQEVVQRIVHRYIMDVQRQNEDRGNVDEIRGAFDTMKCEVFTNCRQKDEHVAVATEALNSVAFDLYKMADGDLDTEEPSSMCELLDWWSAETSKSVIDKDVEFKSNIGCGDLTESIGDKFESGIDRYVDVSVENYGPNYDGAGNKDKPSFTGLACNSLSVVPEVEVEADNSDEEDLNHSRRSTVLGGKHGVVLVDEESDGISVGGETDDSILRCRNIAADNIEDHDDDDENEKGGIGGACDGDNHIDDDEDDDDDDSGGILDDIVDYVMFGDEKVADDKCDEDTRDDEMVDGAMGEMRIERDNGISCDEGGIGVKDGDTSRHEDRFERPYNSRKY